jgi:lysophospholipase L1-like esterase
MIRSKQILLKLSVTAVSLLFMVIIAEIGLRLAGISYPRTTQADMVLGVIHRPGAKFRYRDEGDAWVEYNSDGFRDVQWPIVKPRDEYRIAVLGDSYVEALQIPVEYRLTELLAHNLNGPYAFGGKTVRVMNFGMSGFGTGQELLLLKDRVAKFQPDLVVLGFLTSNDLSDNCRLLRPHQKRPFFLLRDGKLALDDSYKEWVASEGRPRTLFLYKLADWSRIIQLAYRVRRNLHARAETARALARRADGPQELGLDSQVYVEPSTPAWREAWDITEQLLLALNDEVRMLGATLLVVTLSTGEQVHPDPAVRAEFANRLGVKELTYPDKRIARFCDDHNIAVLTLAPLFVEYAQANNVYLHGFDNAQMGRGHWNQAGHRLAADLITKKILELQSTQNVAPAEPSSRESDEGA